METLRRLGNDPIGALALGTIIGTGIGGTGHLLICALVVPVILLQRIRYRWLMSAACVIVMLVAIPRLNDGQRTWDPFAHARTALLAPLLQTTPGDAGALAAGLTLGESGYFSSDFKKALYATSTSHIVALSGFNVALILGVLRKRLVKHLKGTTLRTLLVGVLVAFVCIAGFQASLVRAALMGTVVLLGTAHSKRIAPARLLLLTAATMLLSNPSWMSNLGFQLSFISTWGILVMVGDMERILILEKWKTAQGIVLPSIAAQLSTAPALLAATGSVALIGLVLNPLITPTTALLTGISTVQLLLAHSAPALASMSAHAVELAHGIPIELITWGSHLPLKIHAALSIPAAATIYIATLEYTARRKPELW